MTHEVAIRHVLLLLALLTLACGDDTTGPSTGTLNVSFDAASCNPGNAEVFIDGTSQGAYFWIPGQSRGWSVAGGTHAVGAREVGGSFFIWPAQTVDVPTGGASDAIFTC